MITILVAEHHYEKMELCCRLIRSVLPDCNLIKTGDFSEANRILSTGPIDAFFIGLTHNASALSLAEKINSDPAFGHAYVVFLSDAKMDRDSLFQEYHYYEYLEYPLDKTFFEARLKGLFLQLKALEQYRIRVLRRPGIITVGTKRGVEFLRHDEILFVETDGRKIHIATKKRTYQSLPCKLDDFVRQVASPYFCKCHRGYAVNLRNVSRAEPVNSRLWHFFFNEKSELYCPCSGTYFHDLSEKFFSKKSGMNCSNFDMKF